MLRHAVAYVPQEPELFTGSVRDNIVLGRPWASEEEIAEVAKLAGVEAFTAAHPLGLGLPVGERGLRLSGGQRQAVALARMLIRKPSVLFLDEPSSALDTATEAGLVQELAAWLGKDMTLIVSTHKGQFLKLVDRLVVIDAGRIVADGPRDEILAQDEGRPARQAAGRRRGRAAPGDGMKKPDDLDFANDIRAAVERQSGRGASELIALVVVALGLAGVWANYAIIDETTSAQGRVIPSSQLQVVQTLEGGIVREILIAEGDLVEAGEVLMNIDDTGAASRLGELKQKRFALLAETAGSRRR